jgi:hypothetical protein
VNGIGFESYIVPRQKRFFMLIERDVVKKIGANIGETVKVAVEL